MNVADLLEMDSSDIDFKPLQLKNGLDEMRHGAIYEAYRLYEQKGISARL